MKQNITKKMILVALLSMIPHALWAMQKNNKENEEMCAFIAAAQILKKSDTVYEAHSTDASLPKRVLIVQKIKGSGCCCWSDPDATKITAQYTENHGCSFWRYKRKNFSGAGAKSMLTVMKAKFGDAQS